MGNLDDSIFCPNIDCLSNKTLKGDFPILLASPVFIEREGKYFCGVCGCTLSSSYDSPETQRLRNLFPDYV